jgi:hypothetical protein
MSLASRRALFVSVAFVLAASPAARAETWTGLASPDNNWTTVANWDTGVPVSGSAANFNSAGNGNTAINLGGASQPLNTLDFEAGAAAYTIGQTAGDTLNFDGSGALIIGSGVTTAQTINAVVQTNGGLTVANFAPNGLTTGNGLVGLTLGAVNISGSGAFIVDGSGVTGAPNTTTVLNGNITETAGQPASVIYKATITGSSNNTNFVINGNNTYTGGTTIQVNTGSGGSIQIGTDSPFGTGKVTSVLVNNSPQLSAVGGTRTINNA